MKTILFWVIVLSSICASAKQVICESSICYNNTDCELTMLKGTKKSIVKIPEKNSADLIFYGYKYITVDLSKNFKTKKLKKYNKLVRIFNANSCFNVRTYNAK